MRRSSRKSFLLETRVSQVESKVEEMDKRLGEVEKKVGEQTSGSSGDTHVAFKPSYLEIKAFATSMSAW